MSLPYSYKFILDLDGHGWSQRFRKELTAGAVVVKSTIHVCLAIPANPPWHSLPPGFPGRAPPPPPPPLPSPGSAAQDRSLTK